MNSETELAFDHPESRAAATAGQDPLDRISLRDHVVDVEIGAFQAERDTIQRISFNVVVEVRAQLGPLDDDVDKILSYDTIAQGIRTELRAERLNLLETLAARVAERILAEPQAERVFVRIEKLDRGPGALGVEIVRTKPDGQVEIGAATQVQTSPVPVVVFFSNRAIASQNLVGWLDALEKSGKPVMLCVGMPDQAAAQSGSDRAQRRIDLLAIEQNAWVLAGLDQRCVVVSTRTEIEWAMKNAQISIWAPSKVVLDAVDEPSGDARDAFAWASWIAAKVNAEKIISVDAKPSSTGKMAVTCVGLNDRILF